MNKKIILFGSGSYGQKAIEYYGKENIALFCDNNENKIGSFIDGIEVISPEKLRKLFNEYQIVISVEHIENIEKQLISYGITDCTLFFPELPLINEKVKEYLEINKSSILVYDDERAERLARSVIASFNITSLSVKSISEAVLCSSDNFIILSRENHQALFTALLKTKKRSQLFDPFANDYIYETDNVIFNRYENDNYRGDIALQYDIDRVNYFANLVGEIPPLFEYIEVETINRCNGKCEFCPVNAAIDPREKKVMTTELYYSIVDQLAELDYNGVFSPYSNNEAFLDTRMINFCEYAKNKLANSKILIYTNGTMLTIDKFIKAIEYIDELVIDNYDVELLPTSEAICCNDPYGRDTLGDLTVQTIEQVWFGEKYSEVRKALQSGRKNYPHCVNCDVFLLQ